MSIISDKKVLTVFSDSVIIKLSNSSDTIKGGETMAKLKVHRAFDEFLLDPNLSLRAKGFLTTINDRCGSIKN